MDVKSRLQTRLDTYRTGIEVVAVSIRESRPPDAVKEAFDDVVKAREDEVRLRNEAETYANEVVPIARGELKEPLKMLKDINKKSYLKLKVRHQDLINYLLNIQNLQK